MHFSKQDQKRLMRHFGIDQNDFWSHQRKLKELYEKMQAANMAEPTGRFVVTSKNIPTKKVIKELASLGIIVEPELRIDLDKVRKITGDNNV